jgi:DNA repair exonuclease SbcCD ATPase subunit
VIIRLRWPDDRVMAYRLVDAAQQNFLEMRHVLEVSTIAEQISILEGHAANLKKDIMKQVEQLQQSQQRSVKEGHPLPRAPVPKGPDANVVNLRVMLEGKRRALTDLEDYRRRHLTELQTRLAEQRAVYSQSHPAIIDLEQSIESLKRDSPQLLALRQEESDLRQQLSRLDISETAPSAALAIPADLFRDRGEDSTVEYERAQLRFAAQQYAHMRERIDAGRIDLDTARAAFKYRYSVVVPAQVPRGPIKPKALLVMSAALIAGILLALFATTATDFRSGVVLETWQLQNLLGPGQAVIEVSSP